MSVNSEQDKAWLISRGNRLSNYCLLKVGIMAILSVYGIADFMNATAFWRGVYCLFLLMLVFYVYLYFDTKKFSQKLERFIKSSL